MYKDSRIRICEATSELWISCAKWWMLFNPKYERGEAWKNLSAKSWQCYLIQNSHQGNSLPSTRLHWFPTFNIHQIWDELN